MASLLMPCRGCLAKKCSPCHLAVHRMPSQRRYPNDRQRSLLASVELSLRRLPAEVRQKLGPLGGISGGGNLVSIAQVVGLDVQQGEEIALGRDLEAVGLGTLLPVGQEMTYLHLHPALAPALWGVLPEVQRRTARDTLATAMRVLVDFLYEQLSKDTHLAVHWTLQELPNLLAALSWLATAAEAGQATASAETLDDAVAAPTWEAVVNMATSLESPLQYLGRPRALASVADVRARVAAHMGTWSHARFAAEYSTVERLDNAGRLAEAVAAARTLLLHTQATGPERPIPLPPMT